jgi:phytoene synthase
MMVEALDIKGKEAKYFAIDLGIAMQLTNISRDLMQDHMKNRIYFPENTGINENTLNTLTIDNKDLLKKVTNQLLLKADIFYNSSLNGIRYIPIKSRISILIALRIYQGIGAKIRKTGTKYLYENIFVSKFEKSIIVIKTIFEFLIFFIIPYYKTNHKKYLHESLSGLIDVHQE